MDTLQNLAKQTAIHFGSGNIIDSVENTVGGKHTQESPVVDITSSHIKSNTTYDEGKMKTQPRGFFADQFEVRC